jgi:hypothetical protein
VQEGEDLGGASKARTVAHVEDDGDESFLIEDAANTACRSLTPNQPLFHVTY